MYALHYH